MEIRIYFSTDGHKLYITGCQDKEVYEYKLSKPFDVPNEIKIRKQKEIVYKWWGNLTDMRQYEIMLEWYPTEVKEDTDIDKMFGDMPYKYQLEIYEGENEEKEKF